MFRVLISLLLISLNLLYVFEAHSRDVSTTSNDSSSVSFELHYEDACPGEDHGHDAPEPTHECHLGHCSFILSSFFVQFKVFNIVQSYTSNQSVASPYLDDELRPPIFS